MFQCPKCSTAYRAEAVGLDKDWIGKTNNVLIVCQVCGTIFNTRAHRRKPGRLARLMGRPGTVISEEVTIRAS